MARILFTHSYFYRFDPKQWKAQMPYPPYGTIQAAAVMWEAGHEVHLFDTNLRHSPEEIVPVLEEFRPDYLVVYDDGFNYLTKMCLTNMREAAFRLARLGREHSCTVLVSSSDSTDHYGQYLDEGADYIILGEGEITLSESIATLEQGETDLSALPGLAFRRDGETIYTGKRPVLRELDSLPMPAWNLVDIPAYRDIWMRAHGYFSLNLATTRGCPFKCNWCAKPIYGNRYNVRSPERVVEELAHLIHTYGASYFWMCDDIFGLKPGWVQRFRDLVLERGLKCRYKMQGRVDLLLEDDTIEALAASGLDTVWVGAESGSQKVLDAMDKGTRVEQIREATHRLKAHSVKVAFFLQFGYPGETAEDIRKTIALVLELMPDDIGISVSYPLPGTGFYEKVKGQLSEKANWTDSDDLAMMYRSTFSPAFYRRLHRYVHKVYRRKQALQQMGQIVREPLKPHRWKRALSAGYYLPMAAVDRWRLKRLEREAVL
jgi:anaerobic magnesium-protoporphyrin IX monomethyl ester cyclase